MNDWNVVVTVKDEGYNAAWKLLEKFGRVAKTDYFNLLLMQVPDPRRLLENLREQGEGDPMIARSLARVMPVLQSFTFQTPEEFEEKAREAVTVWLPQLGGKKFYLRMHRRGFKGKLSSLEEERFLDTYLLDALEEAGMDGKISFGDPDAIISLETVGPRAGLSLWTREDLERYPLLHLD